VLVYLNTRTFLDARGALAQLVQRALDAKVTVVMLHEQDIERGGGSIRDVIVQTPEVLRLPPYELYNTLAIPLFSSPEHHTVSMWKALSAIDAATGPAAGPFAKLSDTVPYVPRLYKNISRISRGGSPRNLASAASNGNLGRVAPNEESSSDRSSRPSEPLDASPRV
jgi:hypothetical protein